MHVLLCLINFFFLRPIYDKCMSSVVYLVHVVERGDNKLLIPKLVFALLSEDMEHICLFGYVA
jgi:hypothetical protein